MSEGLFDQEVQAGKQSYKLWKVVLLATGAALVYEGWRRYSSIKRTDERRAKKILEMGKANFESARLRSIQSTGKVRSDLKYPGEL